MTQPSLCLCGSTLSPKNRSGLCKSCNAVRLNADPAIAARREEMREAYFNRPGVREAYARRIEGHIRNMSDQERERRRAHGRRLAREVLSRPEVRAKAASPEARAQAGQARSATTLAWCPEYLRDFYRGLTRKGIRAAAARARTLAEHERLRRAELNPDAAARHLQRFAPIYRCDAAGAQRIGGSHWRYGSMVLDRDGVIALALRKGWEAGFQRPANLAESTHAVKAGSPRRIGEVNL